MEADNVCERCGHNFLHRHDNYTRHLPTCTGPPKGRGKYCDGCDRWIAGSKTHMDRHKSRNDCRDAVERAINAVQVAVNRRAANAEQQRNHRMRARQMAAMTIIPDNTVITATLEPVITPPTNTPAFTPPTNTPATNTPSIFPEEVPTNTLDDFDFFGDVADFELEELVMDPEEGINFGGEDETVSDTIIHGDEQKGQDSDEEDDDNVEITQVVPAPAVVCDVCHRVGESWIFQGPDCEHVAHNECVRDFNIEAGIEDPVNFRCPQFPCPCRFPPEIEDLSDDDDEDYSPTRDESSSDGDSSSEESE